MHSKYQQHFKKRVAMALFVGLAAPSSHAFTPTGKVHVNTKVITDSPSTNNLRSRLWENSDGVESSADKLMSASHRIQLKFKDTLPDVASFRKRSTQPTPALVLASSYVVDHLRNAKKNHVAIAAMSVLAFALAMPLPSEAAMSGGRMGGSYSSPSRSSGGGGYTRMAPRSSGGYSRGLGTGFAAGYGVGAFSRPSYVTPFYSPFSVFPRPYYSPGYGAISYNPFPIFPLLLFAGVALAINSASSAVSDGVRGFSPSTLLGDQTSALGSGTSFVQVTLALEVSDRDDRNSILSVLDRLAHTARTDSRVGIQNLTSQVALELLRRKSSVISASSKYKHFSDRTKALREYNSRSIAERGKFESETVSNYGGVDYSGRGARSSSAGDSKATMAVVTLLLAIDGDSTKVPQINSISDLEDALRKIATDVKVDDCLQSAEILWTPEERYETLSPRDVIADYPELRSL